MIFTVKPDIYKLRSGIKPEFATLNRKMFYTRHLLIGCLVTCYKYNITDIRKKEAIFNNSLHYFKQEIPDSILEDQFYRIRNIMCNSAKLKKIYDCVMRVAVSKIHTTVITICIAAICEYLSEKEYCSAKALFKIVIKEYGYQAEKWYTDPRSRSYNAVFGILNKIFGGYNKSK